MSKSTKWILFGFGAIFVMLIITAAVAIWAFKDASVNLGDRIALRDVGETGQVLGYTLVEVHPEQAELPTEFTGREVMFMAPGSTLGKHSLFGGKYDFSKCTLNAQPLELVESSFNLPGRKATAFYFVAKAQAPAGKAVVNCVDYPKDQTLMISFKN